MFDLGVIDRFRQGEDFRIAMRLCTLMRANDRHIQGSAFAAKAANIVAMIQMFAIHEGSNVESMPGMAANRPMMIGMKP